MAGKVNISLEQFLDSSWFEKRNSSQPLIMGILNLTPDSFFEGSRFCKPDEIVMKVGQMINEGMDILDLGAVSTRPGSVDPGLDEEMNRLLLPLKLLKKQYPDLVISVDTFRGEVANEALKHGAHMINDISASAFSGDMLDIVSEYQCPYIMMHMQGSPLSMQENPVYDDVVKDIISFFKERIQKCNSLGINKIILDPGFGFGKTMDHNYEILARLPEFEALGSPLLAGLSRKSMLYRLLGTDASSSLNATTAAHMMALVGGASILRVHDVKYAREAVAVFMACKKFQDA